MNCDWRWTGGHADSDKVKDDVHVSDAGRITTSRPAAEVAQVRSHTRQRVTAGSLDYGPREESGSTEAQAAFVEESGSAERLCRPRCVDWTGVTITWSSDALLPGL